MAATKKDEFIVPYEHLEDRETGKLLNGERYA